MVLPGKRVSEQGTGEVSYLAPARSFNLSKIHSGQSLFNVLLIDDVFTFKVSI